MKTTTLSKFAAFIIATAVTLPVVAGEIVVKPSRYTPPAKSQFATPHAAPIPLAACCKEKYTTATTQDTKLKTKTVLVAKHECPACKTTVKAVGAQKAGRKEVAEHTCAGKVTTVAVCCAEMPDMK